MGLKNHFVNTEEGANTVEILNELSDEEKSKVEENVKLINEYKGNIEDCNYYLNNSIKMKLDPNKFYRGTIRYTLVAESENSITDLFAFFDSEIFNEDNFKKLSELLNGNVESSLLKEVVAVEKNRFENANAEYIVTIEHYNIEECEKMLSFFGEKIDTCILKDAKTNANKNEADVYMCCDNRLMKLKKDVLESISIAYNEISVIENRMTDGEKEYYELLTDGEQGEKENTVENEATTMGAKEIILGLILGIICSVGYYSVRYIFSGRIHNSEEMKSWISLPVYEYAEQEKIKDIFENLISAIKNKLINSKEESLDVIVTMISNAVKQKDIKTIYLFTSSKEYDEEVFVKLKEIFRGEDIELVIGTNDLTDINVIQNIIKCGNVLLWEKCELSLEKDIRNAMNKFNMLNVEVLGVILEA